MAPALPECVDTVIVGNGPSALILSYILHGHIPYYIGHHHDPILHAKLSAQPNLLRLTSDVYAHLQASLRYSTQALPINTLLDTLIRENADTEVNPQSCVEWRYEPAKAVSHVALGSADHPGGQWDQNPSSTAGEIGTLSYAEMLSLPGYSFAEHYLAVHGTQIPDFQRPSRIEVAAYYAAFPKAVGLADTVRTSTQVDRISRTENGFLIGSHGIRCAHLVLASGIFSINIPPPPLLSPLLALKTTSEPLLVIGSGFSAADAIISAPPWRKIIHMFKWSLDERPSPLRGCHHQAYPEYAGVYRQMKLATMAQKRYHTVSPLMRKKSNPFFASRDWATIYEGLPNAQIENAVKVSESSARITIRLDSGKVIERPVGGLAFAVGRRGTLRYLERSLRENILNGNLAVSKTGNSLGLISGRTLRQKAEVDLEVANAVFIIGSLTGDSLVRHAFGGCVYAAGKIMRLSHRGSRPSTPTQSIPCPEGSSDASRCSTPASMSVTCGSSPSCRADVEVVAHEDLHLDRRKAVPKAVAAAADD